MGLSHGDRIKLQDSSKFDRMELFACSIKFTVICSINMQAPNTSARHSILPDIIQIVLCYLKIIFVLRKIERWQILGERKQTNCLLLVNVTKYVSGTACSLVLWLNLVLTLTTAWKQNLSLIIPILVLLRPCTVLEVYSSFILIGKN